MVSHAFCVNILRLEQLYELLALSMMADLTQSTIVSVASELPMIGLVA